MSEPAGAPGPDPLSVAKSQPGDEGPLTGQEDSKNPRKRAPLLLYDGLPEAISRIRSRQGLTQEDVARRARSARLETCKVDEKADLLKFDGRKWSEYENNVKRLLKADLPNVLAGLGCEEFDLWEEKVHVERLHYRMHAREIAEEEPKYDTSLGAMYADSLYRLDVDQLPPAEQQWFHEFRNAVAAAAASTFAVADHVLSRYRQLKRQAGKF